MYFEMAARDIRALPKLEGTVHVNMALVLKFMAGVPVRPAGVRAGAASATTPADDEFLFHQGPARGLGKIRFHDWRLAYDAFADVPNVARFVEQAEGLKQLLTTAPPSEEQITDLDFLLTLGELFTLVVYGQLICEQAALDELDRRHVDQIFDVLVRDFSGYAVALHGQARRRPRRSRTGRLSAGAQAGRRRRALRARLGAGPRARGRLRDAPLDGLRLAPTIGALGP